MRCPCGNSFANESLGAVSGSPGLTTKLCQELADDRKVYPKRGPPISSELCPAAGHLRRKRGRCRKKPQVLMSRLSLRYLLSLIHI